MAAQLEEVVVDADRLDAEQLLPDPGERASTSSARRHVGGGERRPWRLRAGAWQGLPVASSAGFASPAGRSCAGTTALALTAGGGSIQ